MSILDTLEINNFRGIKFLKVEDLSTVNILVGNNGVGKTTVLEAVAMLVGVRPRMFEYLANKRDLRNPHQTVSSLFYLGKPNTNPILKGSTKEKLEHKLKISSIDYAQAQKLINSTAPHSNEDNIDFNELNGIEIAYSFGSSKESISTHAPHIDHYHSDEVTSKKNGGGIFYISSRQANSIHETAAMLSRVQENPEKEERLYDALKSLCPNLRRLRNVFFGGKKDVGVTVDFNDGTSVPINFLGDGFCRLTLILTGLYSRNSQNLIVDDIDSGIHNENMADIWLSLVNLALKEKVQIFCVTHNEEMLQASLEAFKEKKSHLRVFRINKKGDIHSSQKYDYDLFESTVQMGMPVK